MKDWEIIADNLSKAGFRLGCVLDLDLEGRTVWIVDAHRGGKRFVVRADEEADAVLELNAAIGAGPSGQAALKDCTVASPPALTIR